jgi:L-lactate dehydrogenase complex protein LldG
VAPSAGAAGLVAASRSGFVTAREVVLSRIRAALGPDPVVPEIPREYRGPTPAGDAVVDRFCERVAEYRASVIRVAPDELAATVSRLCAGRRIAVPPGGPDVLSGVEVVVDDPPLTPQALDALDGVLTGCALAIAETGTIVLDGGERSGRRALTLVPDWHVCIVEAGSVVAGVPDAVAALASAAAEGRPITLVSGPSATSDIELDRVEGVHGPRTLDVVVVG